MFQSNGVLTKGVVWEGSTRDYYPGIGMGWSAQTSLGSYAFMYRNQHWVATCVDKIANASARLPLKVYERDVQGRPEARGHPYAMLLRRPSEVIDPYLFWLWTVSTLNIEGESFWGKVRDRGGRPISLVPLHPSKIFDEPDSNGVTTWFYRGGYGPKVSIDRRDLVHFRMFNPGTLGRGMSPMEPLRATLENEDGARRANSALWRNGGRPSVVLEHPELLNDGASRRLSAQWKDIHSGVDNWAKALILEEGMKANMTSLNVEELQYIEARKLNREETCARYDIPPPVVHILDKATYSNITEQMRSMYRDTMAPKLGLLESTLEFELRDGRMGQDVDPDFGDTVYAEFLMDEVLRGAFEARSAAYQSADWLTLAEKREMENRPFIPGTDHIFLNSASLPLSESGTLTQPAAVTNGGVATPDEIALMLQKIYLAVGVVITADEAREILNRAGAGLTGSGPAGKALTHAAELAPSGAHALPATQLRAVMGRLGRAKSVNDVDPEKLVAGLDDGDVAVLTQLLEAQIAGEGIDAFKSRLRALAQEVA